MVKRMELEEERKRRLQKMREDVAKFADDLDRRRAGEHITPLL